MMRKLDDARLIVAEQDSYTMGMLDRKYVLVFTEEEKEKVLRELERDGWLIVDTLIPKIDLSWGILEFEETEAYERDY